MANIMNKFLDFMKLGGDEDEYDEDYYEDEETVEERIPTRTSNRRQKTSSETRSRRMASEDASLSDTVSDTPRRERSSARTERGGSKLVALQSAQKRSMEVCIQKPTSFDDSEELADMIIRGQAVVVNFEGLSHDDAAAYNGFSAWLYICNGWQIKPDIKVYFPVLAKRCRCIRRRCFF